MKKFAYLDSAYILHITKNEAIAKSHSVNGKVIATDIAAKGGYPVDHGGNAYILYAENDEKHGKKIPAELSELYISLK